MDSGFNILAFFEHATSAQDHSMEHFFHKKDTLNSAFQSGQ